MTKSAESFYTSIGFPALPQTFWERSMLYAAARPRSGVPRQRLGHGQWRRRAHQDVHASPIEEDLFTIYHELGHVYYYIWYKDQPELFQDGAHDGFHEAIGDTVNLSVTPGYLHQIGLVSAVKPSPGGRHQPADEDGARQDRVPAVRQAHRRVALGRVRRPRSSRRTTTRPGGSCAASTRAWRRRWRAAKKISIRARSTTSPATRRTRATSCRSSCSSSSTRRCATPPASRARCTSARSSTARKPARSTPRCSSSAPASRGRTRCEKLTGTRQMDASAIIEYFKPLEALARRTEQGPDLRLGMKTNVGGADECERRLRRRSSPRAPSFCRSCWRWCSPRPTPTSACSPA